MRTAVLALGALAYLGAPAQARLPLTMARNWRDGVRHLARGSTPAP